MKTIQIQSGKDNNNEILKAAGVKRIWPGWYKVTFNGIALDNSTVVSATRNTYGLILNN